MKIKIMQIMWNYKVTITRPLYVCEIDILLFTNQGLFKNHTPQAPYFWLELCTTTSSGRACHAEEAKVTMNGIARNSHNIIIEYHFILPHLMAFTMKKSNGVSRAMCHAYYQYRDVIK